MRMANGVAAKELEGEEEGDKAGRVLAKRNATKIMAAMDELKKLMMDAGMMDEEATKTLADLEEKCGDMPKAEAPEPARPYGGAKTFAEVDALLTYNREEGKVSEQIQMFRDLQSNIWYDEDLTLAAKMAATRALIDDLDERVANPPEYKEEGENLLDRIKTLVFGEKAKTKSEEGKSFPASDYAYVPDAESPTTWKLRLTSTPGGDPDSNIVGAAAAALGKGFRGNKVQIPAGDLTAVKSRVRSAWRKANPDKKPEDMPPGLKETSDGMFTLFKDADGSWRFVVSATNKFEDKEGEIFSEAAHREFVSYVEDTKEFPEAWLWHTPGSRVGQADFIDYVDGFLLLSGTFDKGMEAVAEKLYDDRANIGISHGYKYLNDGSKQARTEGVYPFYRMFEVTFLPLERESNPWTLFSLEKEEFMGLREDKKQWLIGKLGEERVSSIEGALGALGKELEEGGIRFKDLVSDEAPPEPVVPAGDTPEGGAPEVPAIPETPAVPEAVAALGQRVEAVESQNAEILEGIKTLGEVLKELQKSDEDKISELLSPRRKVAAKERPSEGTETEISDEEAKELIGTQVGSGGESTVDPYLEQLGIKVS